MLELREAGLAAGQQLVHVRLVAGVEDDAVLRRVEDTVHGDRELDHAEVRPKVTARSRRRLDEKITDLRGQAGELVLTESLQVLRAVDALQQGHVDCSSSAVRA